MEPLNACRPSDIQYYSNRNEIDRNLCGKGDPKKMLKSPLGKGLYLIAKPTLGLLCKQPLQHKVLFRSSYIPQEAFDCSFGHVSNWWREFDELKSMMPSPQIHASVVVSAPQAIIHWEMNSAAWLNWFGLSCLSLQVFKPAIFLIINN